MTIRARFPIGTKFKTQGKNPRSATVVDIWTTTNNAGAIVRVNYVTEHEFLGQKVRDHSVADTTIARSMNPDEFLKFANQQDPL